MVVLVFAKKLMSVSRARQRPRKALSVATCYFICSNKKNNARRTWWREENEPTTWIWKQSFFCPLPASGLLLPFARCLLVRITKLKVFLRNAEVEFGREGPLKFRGRYAPSPPGGTAPTRTSVPTLLVASIAWSLGFHWAGGGLPRLWPKQQNNHHSTTATTTAKETIVSILTVPPV